MVYDGIIIFFIKAKTTKMDYYMALYEIKEEDFLNMLYISRMWHLEWGEKYGDNLLLFKDLLDILETQ